MNREPTHSTSKERNGAVHISYFDNFLIYYTLLWPIAQNYKSTTIQKLSANKVVEKYE